MGHEVNSKVQPSPGEALRRLREFVAHLWDECHDGGDFERTADAQKLDTLLAPLYGPVDGLMCATHGGFDARCETCPFCLQERSLKRLAGPVDASGEPERPIATRLFEEFMGHCICGLKATTFVPMWRGMSLAVCERCKVDAAAAVPSSPVAHSEWLSNEQVDAIDRGRRLRAVAAYNAGITDKQ